MNIQFVSKTGSGAAAPKDPNVIIIATKDIVSWPSRDPKKVKMLGNFTFTANPKIAIVYMTASKTKAPYESEGEEDSQTIKQSFEGEHPGDKLEINEFVAEWLNEPCIIIHGSCQDDFRKVVGTKCAPIRLKPSGQNDNDARKHMMKFEQYAKSEWLPGHFTGAVPTSDPFVVSLATAVTVNEANGNLYQLPELAVTAAINFAAIDLNHGSIVTLIGGGGAQPATLTSGVTDKKAILIAATTWVGLKGAVIHLEVFRNGGLTFLIEKSRG
ncbi:MAG: hypothetical protein K2Y30_01925 [Flavobacteriaceae bacterium]|nr:hypothetical protein [Flavobacteriaceae bacterium]